jgi:tartrate-resistant acid phosphatase type 5
MPRPEPATRPHRAPARRVSARDVTCVVRTVLALAACLLLQACASYSYLAVDLQPAPGSWGTDHRHRQELVFLVFGDSGMGGAVQSNVGRAMQAVCATHACDFALLLGDNIYNRGVRGVDDDQFRTKFEEPYAVLGRLDVWAVPGNHDWRRPESVQAQIAYTARSERWRMPHNHYAVPRLPDWIRLYGLDTSVIADLPGQTRPDRRRALEQSRREQLAAARGELCGGGGWKLLFGHHPIYSGGHHGRDEPEGGVLQAIEDALLADVVHACGVQVYFAGHEHHQEHIHGPAFEQIIQGAAGRELRPVGRLDGPDRTQAFAASRYGFGLVRVDPQRMSIEFFEVLGDATAERIYGTSCRPAQGGVGVACVPAGAFSAPARP